MEANNNSILIAEQQLQTFLNSLQQYIGQPETILQVINQKIVELNLIINHEDNNFFNGGLKRRKKGKTGKKRKRGTMKTSRKKRKRSKN